MEYWPKCSYFAIYDGHGGSACADFLRDNLHLFVYLFIFIIIYFIYYSYIHSYITILYEDNKR